MDPGLPGREGYAIAQEIRNTPALRNIALIALSGYGQAPDKQAADAAGFDARPVKPAETETLVRAIETHVLRRRSSAAPVAS